MKQIEKHKLKCNKKKQFNHFVDVFAARVCVCVCVFFYFYFFLLFSFFFDNVPQKATKQLKNRQQQQQQTTLAEPFESRFETNVVETQRNKLQKATKK